MTVTDLRTKVEGMMVWYYPTPEESKKCMRTKRIVSFISELEGGDSLELQIMCPGTFPLLKRNVHIRVNVEDVGVWDYPEQIRHNTTQKVLAILPAFILTILKIKI